MPWPDLDPQIVALVLDGAEELAVWAWHKLTGETDSDKARKAIDAIRAKGAAAQIRAQQEELEAQAAAINMTAQLAKLGPLTEHVLDAFVPKGDMIPQLGLNIEQVTEFDDERK